MQLTARKTGDIEQERADLDGTTKIKVSTPCTCSEGKRKMLAELIVPGLGTGSGDPLSY